jgi:hypothetical protein
MSNSRAPVRPSTIGGYSGPRCATVEKRSAVAVERRVSSGRRYFDYYPPIKTVCAGSWAPGLEGRAEKITEFTLVGRANKIECPLLVG